MFNEEMDVTRIVVAAQRMRNQIIAEMFRSVFRKMRDAVRHAAPGLKHHHA